MKCITSNRDIPERMGFRDFRQSRDNDIYGMILKKTHSSDFMQIKVDVCF